MSNRLEQLRRTTWAEELYKAEVTLPARRPMRVKDLHAGDYVEHYGKVEWVELPDGPNALVDFVGVKRGVHLAKSMRVVVRR